MNPDQPPADSEGLLPTASQGSRSCSAGKGVGGWPGDKQGALCGTARFPPSPKFPVGA